MGEPVMAIDWASVSWVYIGVLAVFVFLSSLVGSLLSFRHHLWGSALSALLFAVIFVFWTYYPHNVPLPTRPAGTAAPAPASMAPAAPQKPSDRFQAAPPTQPNQ
jgi:hypothetical protein